MGRGNFERESAPHCKVYGHSAVIRAKKGEPIEMLFGLCTPVGPRIHILDGAQMPHAKGQLLGEKHDRACPTTLCRELCKNGRTDRFAVWVVDSGGPEGRI